MGFGFYGRSFQLADVSCSSPGCAFSGAGTAGPCSDASGIMYYYEIMALLKQHPELNPVWDKSAGVKYVVFDTDQWISYDDADTFAQKVTYANTLGLGGALIWASDAGKNPLFPATSSEALSLLGTD
jgi:GH18 family chitinase